MKSYYIVIALVISLLAHLFFFTNIEFSFNEKPTNEDLVIDMISMPAVSPDNLGLNTVTSKKNSIKDAEENKIKKLPSLLNKNKIQEPSLILNNHKNNADISNQTPCDLCQPVEDFLVPEDEPAYGQIIESIKIQYKVFHELGPNKCSLKNVSPFGSVGKEIKKNSRSEVGVLNIDYIINKANYTISYEAKANGLSSLIYSKPLIQKSDGLIDENGLKPTYYIYQFGDKRRNEAFFDWKNKKLKIVRKNETQLFDLIENTQDQLSFMFQFMFLNPMNKMQVPITNAKIFKIYNYQYISEGQMKTDVGDINYVQVAKFNYQDPERIDLWLAKDYGFLPFKVSIIDEDMSVIIQEIHQIQVKKND